MYHGPYSKVLSMLKILLHVDSKTEILFVTQNLKLKGKAGE